MLWFYGRMYSVWLFTIDPRLNVQSFIEASNYIKKGVTILQMLRNNEKMQKEIFID